MIAGDMRRRFTVIGGAICLLLAAIAASPFLFTTRFVSIALTYALPANDPVIASAALSTNGVLVIRGLVIHDTGKLANQPLVAAREVRVEFRWRELSARKIRRVTIDAVAVYARVTGPSQLSLLNLVPRKAPTTAAPPEIDAIEISGTLHSEPIPGFTRSASQWPLSLHMIAGKEPGTRQFTATLGDTRAVAQSGARAGGFGVSAEGEARQSPAGMRIIMRRVAVRNASIAIASATVRHFVPAAPEFHGPVTAALASLSASGELAVHGATAQVSGKIQFSGVRVRLPDDPGMKLIVNDASGAVDVGTPFPPGPATRVSIRRLHLGSAEGSIDAGLLRQYAAKLPAAVQGPLSFTLDALDLSGETSGIGRDMKFNGPVRMQNASMRAASIRNLPLAIEGITAGGEVGVRPGRQPPLDALATRDGSIAWTSLTYGNNVMSGFNAAWGLDQGVLSIDNFDGRVFDGEVAGGVKSMNLAARTAGQLDLRIKSIDIHKVLANIVPDRIDADGRVSGTGNLAVGENTAVAGHLDLAFDGPGILKAGEIPELEQKLAGNFGADLAQLAMRDLRHYPFKEGKLHLESQGINTLLQIKFVRQPRTGAEKIKPRKEIINGREVWVGSLVVPVIDMSIPITGESLTDILSMAAGLHPVLGAGEGAGH